MRSILAIAGLTMKEAVRNRILFLLVGFALFLVCFSWVIGKLTIGDELKIIKDMGLSSIHFFGVLVTILIGISLVFREMEKRTVFLILSKPVERYQFLLGKYVGLAGTLLWVLLVTGGAFYILLVLRQGADVRLIQAFFSMYLEWLLIASIALLFSSFSTPLLSTMLTLALFCAGHLSQSLLLLQNRIAGEGPRMFLSALFYLLPNLELFNIRVHIVQGIPIDAAYFPEALLYWALYTASILLLSIAIFQKKDFV